MRRAKMIEALGCSLILLLSSVEGVCMFKLYSITRKHMQDRSDAKRDEARKAAHKKVHDEWTQFRNRRDLWDYLLKEEAKNYADGK